MWFVWFVLGIVAVVLYMMFGSRGLCPSCGTELGEEFGYPGQPASHCANCGWRQT